MKTSYFLAWTLNIPHNEILKELNKLEQLKSFGLCKVIYEDNELHYEITEEQFEKAINEILNP